MAGLILYLYKQGYRNFLFFVKLTNIIDKTRENFLNIVSSKYLFADEIIIDGEKIRINVVENFQSADESAIDICFDTMQGLHTKILFARENAMTKDDFNERKVVLILDESHNLNVATKKGNSQDEDLKSLEETVKVFIFTNRNFYETEKMMRESLKNIGVKDTKKYVFNVIRASKIQLKDNHFLETDYKAITHIVSAMLKFRFVNNTIKALRVCKHRRAHLVNGRRFTWNPIGFIASDLVIYFNYTIALGLFQLILFSRQIFLEQS